MFYSLNPLILGCVFKDSMAFPNTSVLFGNATALRPNSSSPYQIDDKFSLWKQSFVQNALSQVPMSSMCNFLLGHISNCTEFNLSNCDGRLLQLHLQRSTVLYFVHVLAI